MYGIFFIIAAMGVESGEVSFLHIDSLKCLLIPLTLDCLYRIEKKIKSLLFNIYILNVFLKSQELLAY